MVVALVVVVISVPADLADLVGPGRSAPGAPSRPDVRTVPGNASATGFRVRLAPGSGRYQYTAPIPLPRGAVPFFGDWDGDGAATPGFFLAGVWTLYSTYVGAPAPAATFRYGSATSTPVVGDWNGDGRTDIAFVVDGHWFERDLATAGPVSRVIRFGGLPGDRPVAGDWDGDGVDSPGIRRGDAFLLHDTNEAGPAVTSFSYGRPTDQPVAGDWDGDGRDTVGVVRGSSAWFLLDANRDGAGRDARTVPVVSGSPAPFASPAGADGSGCPTRSATDATPPPTVAAPNVALLGRSMASESPTLQLAMANAQRTLIGPEFDRLYRPKRHQTYLNLRARHRRAEVAIRPSTMTVLTQAVAVSMDGFDEAAIGHTRGEALDQLRWLIASLACQHLAVSPAAGSVERTEAPGRDPGRLRAATTAYAAWVIWDQLHASTRAMVAKMMADEADFTAGRRPSTWPTATASATLVDAGTAPQTRWRGTPAPSPSPCR